MSRVNNKNKAFDAFDRARLAQLNDEPINTDPELLERMEAGNLEAAAELIARKESGRKSNPGGAEDSKRYPDPDEATGSRKRHIVTKRSQVEEALQDVVELGLPPRILRIP